MTAAGPPDSAIERFLSRRRTLVQVGIAGLAWAIALTMTVLLLFDFHASQVGWAGLVALIPLAWLAQTVTGLWVGLYIGGWRYGSFEEVAALVRATAATTLILMLFNMWTTPRLVPRSAPIGAGMAALVLMAAARYGWRLTLERGRRPSGEHCLRLLIFGAGEAAAQVIPLMLRDPDSPYLPVALLDDDLRLRNLRINGVPVVGTRTGLERAVAEHGAEAMLIAIPSASASLVTELSEAAIAAGIEVKVLPTVSELLGGMIGLTDIRDVTSADLLGRHEIKSDLQAIAGYITGRRVLVTGAGGSIGSELCRQIYRLAPSELIMVDRDESALHAVQLSIEGRALLDSNDLVLLDIRDRSAVRSLLHRRRPHVVFHAAALKHLPLLERYPAEAVKTNIWGTLDLLEAAAECDVERFVNISTDKAADPCSVLGYSKRIAERLTTHVGFAERRDWVSVRFGNVLGSRGSVLTTFQAQIDAGGPLTVTHPEATRFFMTVEEAVQLVIQAGAIGRPGDVLVLDMGKPVNIAHVATLLACRSTRKIAVEYTGLRPGEKLHEARLGTGEDDVRLVHPLISHVAAPALEPEQARACDVTLDRDCLTRSLLELCLLPAQMSSPSGE